MWPFRTNPRLKAYLETPAVLEAAENWFFDERSFAKFLLRYSEDQAQRIIAAYSIQTESLRHDPIATDPAFTQIFEEIDNELEKLFPEKRMGQCHSVWRAKKTMLKERGIDWLSPIDLNPYIRFD